MRNTAPSSTMTLLWLIPDWDLHGLSLVLTGGLYNPEVNIHRQIMNDDY